MSEINEQDLREVTGGAGTGEGSLGKFDGRAWYKKNCALCEKNYTSSSDCSKQMSVQKYAERKWNKGIDWSCTDWIPRKG